QFADRMKYFRIPHPTFPNYVTKVADGDDKVIFVIGEASNVKRYSAYGYDVPTTPNLDAMLKNGNICIVQKVHSSTPTTRTSVPMYVSFATPQNRDFLFAYKNILEMASLNGYRTYWIGSQTLDTLWDKTYGFVAKYADVLATPSANTTKFVVNSTKDDDLIAPIHFYFRNAAKKSFFIIHLSGNHLSYDRNLDPEDKAALPDADDYDKSVHHVDRTLRDFMEEADRDFHDYQLVYLPDHGEAVNYGHGFSTKFNEMYLIPLLANSRGSCDEVERMRGVDGYVPGQAVKYLILKLLGYQIDDSAIRDTQRHSFEVLTGDEQIIDFRNLAACQSKDCPD
ncbi:MAG TPA: sulfatase-like hydrolase/transferase, partial [Terriglobales bacterium]|nr:sulfatase-like hydrolase/transferase [Terriglobales bacterium]